MLDFLIELLREVAKGAMRELSAYTFKKRFLDKDNEKTTLSRRKLNRWFSKKDKK